jgi:hypothetical protein
LGDEEADGQPGDEDEPNELVSLIYNDADEEAGGQPNDEGESSEPELSSTDDEEVTPAGPGSV